MHKEDLALNNQPWLIYHKTRPNQTKPDDCTHNMKHKETNFYNL